MNEILVVDNVTKTYGKKGEKQYQALKGINFKVAAGEFVAIMGASGSGKTTLLNILSTLDKPTTGQVFINKHDVSTLNTNQMADFRSKEIGFIFQDFNLLENLSNRENIALPLSLRGLSARRINPLVDRIAAKLGIKEILNKYPAEISGGQKQRVAAARALVHEPSILLADEPTGALDSKSARELLNTMENLNKHDGVTTLMVTHDPFSASFANHILFIKDGKIGEQMIKGEKSRTDFYHELIAHLGTEEQEEGKMIWKLSLTGIKSRFKDYTVLFSGLVVASTIFYMFLSLAINPGFMSKDVNAPGQYLSFIFGFGIVLLAIITFVYLVYANSFLLSMRQHDYGMFMMLGAKSSKLGLLIFCETLLTGILAAILGIIVGLGLTALVSKLLISSLDLHITHFQIILPNAILWTLIFFVVVFFLAALRNVHKLVRSKVIDLLHESQKPIKISRKNGLRVVEAILGLLLLAAGYYIMGMPANAIFFIIPAALVTIVAGSYFTFDSFFTLIINLLLKKKGFAYRGIRVFTLGQLKFRIRDYTRILSVISLLFALALGAITVGLNFNSLKNQAVVSDYYDAQIVQNTPAVQKNVDKLDIKSKATYHYVETKKELFFNKADFDKKPFKYIKFSQHGNDFPTYTPAKTKDLVTPGNSANTRLSMMLLNGTKKIELVSPAEFNTIQGQKKFITLIRVKDFVKDYPTLTKIEKLQMTSPMISRVLSNTKPFTYQVVLGFASGFEFMGFFLGIAFLTMLASTLMFKVLSGAASDKVRYEMLYKIGTREKMLRKSIRNEIGVLFALPGALGIIDVLFGLRLFKALLPKPYMGIWLPFLIFIVLYFIYYIVTVKLYENIVLKKQNLRLKSVLVNKLGIRKSCQNDSFFNEKRPKIPVF